MHYDSLYKALISGIKLIDTSSNYSDGGSELLVGNVVSDLINEGRIKRSDVIIITKGGYIQGQNHKLASRKKVTEQPFKDVVEYTKGTWYSISPDFLSDQIERQLERLIQSEKNGYIDGYLLHNPEIFLDYHEKSAGKDYFKLEYDIHTEYYNRIKKAFTFLEEQVSKGIIKNYGVSSNTLPLSSSRYDFTSLERLLKIAEEVSSKNHFKYIQFPLNIFETNAYFEKSQKHGTKTLIDIAKKNDLIVITNRPLNAITKQGLIRLVEYSSGKFSEENFISQLEKAIELEKMLKKYELQFRNIIKSRKRDAPTLFTLIDKIKNNWNKFSSVEHLNHYIENYFIPKVFFILSNYGYNASPLKLRDNSVITEERIRSYEMIGAELLVEEKVEEEFEANKYLEIYIKELDSLLYQLLEYCKAETVKRNKYINEILESCYLKSKCKMYPSGSEFKNLSLSQKVIQIIRSIPGINYVLVGMRSENYVEDVVELLNYDNISNVDKLLVNLRKEFLKADFLEDKELL